MPQDQPYRVPAREHFTIFGVTPRPVEFAGDSTLFRLAAPFGSGRNLFIQTPAANVHELAEMVVLKLGHLYDRAGQYLSLQDILRLQLVTPEHIYHAGIQGDGALVCFDRRSGTVRMFRALLSVPEIYYRANLDELLCADNLGALLGLLDKPQLDEAIIPMHLMYRLVCGERTYLQGVRRIVEGCQVSWRGGHLTTERVKSLRDFRQETRFHNLDEPALSFLDRQFGDFTSALLGQVVASSGRDYGALLSGGVDSSLIQWFLKQQDAGRSAFHSFSYDMRAPGFQPEVEYAASAVEALGTQHTFFPVTPEAYAGLVVDTIKLLGQPTLAEQEACFLSLAQSIRTQRPDIGYLFIGFGADALMGGSLAEIWWHLGQYRRKPAVSAWLPAVELAMRKIDPGKAFVLRRVLALLPHLNDPNYPEYPGNEYEMYTDFDLMARCFSGQTLHDVFRAWQTTETDLLGSPVIVERAQLVSYLNTERINASVAHQTFLANGTQLIFPYHDERLVKSVFAFDPQVRFYHRGVIKPVLKALLERKSSANSAKKKKLGSGFYPDLKSWMKDGILREMVRAIERPGFISQGDFERKLAEPDWFTWNLLTLDLYQKAVLER
jgi:asparagine synthetase B (glutamine-hydrolysing)